MHEDYNLYFLPMDILNGHNNYKHCVVDVCIVYMDMSNQRRVHFYSRVLSSKGTFLSSCIHKQILKAYDKQ